MHTNIPVLFVEINELDFIFFAVHYDENQNFKIIEKILIPSEGKSGDIFENINIVQEVIKLNVTKIEKKLNHTFKEVIIILDNFNYSSINISGFKKLNGSQLLKENISYILNSLKLVITENEKHKTILHIFNSRSFLDKKRVENLPIGLFGDFYNHELTFFLIGKNYLKNLKKIFNNNNLNIKRIILKSFNEGSQLVSQKKDNDTFFKIKIRKNNSEIIFFDNASFRYSEQFNFGSDIILKDIEKICSISSAAIQNFFIENLNENKNFKNDEFLEKKYFGQDNYRKIRKKLILDIAEARINEIIDIIFKRNINIRAFKSENDKIYLTIENKIIFDYFKDKFKLFFLKDTNFEFQFINNFNQEKSVINAANLSTFGWKKEAVPIAQTKNSLITRIFKSIFD